MARWILTALAGAVPLIASPSVAQTLYWDAAAGADNGVGGTATWGTTFSTSSTGDAGFTTAGAANQVIFQGTAGTVTLAGTQTVESVRFNTTGYTLRADGGFHALAGDITLADGVQLNLGSDEGFTATAGPKIGSVTGGVGSSLRFVANNAKVLLAPGATIAANAPVTLTQTSGYAGFISDGGAATIDAAITRSTALSTGGAWLGATAGSTLNVNGGVSAGSWLILSADAGATIGLNTAITAAQVVLTGGGPGVVKLGVDNPMQTSRLQLGSPGGQTLDLNGHDLTVAGLIASSPHMGAITNNGPGTGTNTLKVAPTSSDNSSALAIPLKDGPTRKTALHYAGNGSFQVSSNNTHTGGTMVSGGDVSFYSGSLPSGGALTVAGGDVELRYSPTIAALTVTGGRILGADSSFPYSINAGAFDLRAGIVAVSLTGPGALVKSTSGTIELLRSVSFTGGAIISAGTLRCSGFSSTLPDTGPVRVDGGTWDLLSLSDTVGAVTLASGAIQGSGGAVRGE